MNYDRSVFKMTKEDLRRRRLNRSWQIPDKRKEASKRACRSGKFER